MRRLLFALLAAVVLVACGGGGEETDVSAPTSMELVPQEGSALNALVASYDIAADRPQRFLVGLVTNDQRLVSFGEAELSFSYLGDGESDGEPEPGPVAVAGWEPIPGQDIASPPDEAAVVNASEGTGVYVASDVEFDQPGFWQVDVSVDIDGEQQLAEAAFQVLDEPAIPASGDPAPATENLLPGDLAAPVKAVDSRATPDGTVPDPELHELTVAQAVATGRPTMVVVATPVFCVSRFCGPITDAVQALAQEHGDAMNFVHIEVWRDFQETILNRGAAEWIFPEGADDAQEPWVWVIDGTGTIIERFDNIATDAELQASVEAATAGAT